MKTIILTGRLGKKFGRSFSLDIASPAEAVRALCVMVAGFEAELRKGAYRLVKVFEDNPETDIPEEMLSMSIGKAYALRIEPVAKGAKSGLWNIVLGVVLVGAAFLFTGGALSGVAFSAFGVGVTGTQIALVGGMMALSGVSSMIAAAMLKEPASGDEKQSFMIDAPKNLAQQGHPVPLIYGECFVGSVVVSNGITTEDFDDD